MGPDDILFYDQAGTPIAYISDEIQSIYTYKGRPAAFIEGECIYNFPGKFLGWFIDGWVLDLDGTRVFYTRVSTGGPNTPIRGIQPIRGIKQFLPARTYRQPKPLKPPFSLSWSSRSGEQFFE